MRACGELLRRTTFQLIYRILLEHQSFGNIWIYELVFQFTFAYLSTAKAIYDHETLEKEDKKER